ncbi:MAG: transcription antitermination factor NusB [Chromatiales bacterium]|nr:transcription antitermination factor NusB [Chromatiales bacterium]
MAVSGRRGARRLLVQALYQHQVGGHERAELAAQFRERAEAQGIDTQYFDSLLGEATRYRPELDALIAQAAARPAERVDPVERAILWLGIAELRSQADVPTRVIINEAIELAKSFGGPESHRFINAVLDDASARLRPRD